MFSEEPKDSRQAADVVVHVEEEIGDGARPTRMQVLDIALHLLPGEGGKD